MPAASILLNGSLRGIVSGIRVALACVCVCMYTYAIRIWFRGLGNGVV